MADQPLRGRKVAILLAPAGSEQAEFTEPRKAVTEAGADVDVIGAQAGPARTVNNDLDPGETFTVDKTFDQASADDYDAVIVPGGTVGADKLRGEAAAVRFVRGIVEAGKPAGVICHGAWTLVGRGGTGTHAHLFPYPGHRHPQRGRHLGGPGSGGRPGSGDQPQPRGPARVLRQDRRRVRRGPAPRPVRQHLTRRPNFQTVRCRMVAAVGPRTAVQKCGRLLRTPPWRPSSTGLPSMAHSCGWPFPAATLCRGWLTCSAWQSARSRPYPQRRNGPAYIDHTGNS